MKWRQKDWEGFYSILSFLVCVQVEHLNGVIYAVGGGDGKEWLSTAEAYDIRRNKWSRVANLKARRWKCGLVAVGDALYAVGGMDSPKAGFWGDPLKSVEK